MARRKKGSKHPLKGGTNIKTGGPGFIGKKGSSPTLMRGSKSGGRKITKGR